jgi:hypothetical protein
MKEIGGYFELEHFGDYEYHKDLIALNNARNALLYLIKAKSIKKLYIPYYLCNSISDVLKKYKCAFEYYEIDERFNPLFDRNLYDEEYIYIVNYFGQLSDDNILSLKRKFKNIIIDNTHAFFQRPINGIYTIYSCRKFFGVPDGAYLSTDKELSEKLETDISKDRMTHILGRFEGVASDYYNNFKKNDNSFKHEPLKYMSKLTRNILSAINYDNVRNIRNENYAYLESKLKEKNVLKLTVPDGAFAYPFYIENGLEIKQKLLAEKIYIPSLWPNVLNETIVDSIEYRYSANILPLPCDQRYNLKDMDRIYRCMLGGQK